MVVEPDRHESEAASRKGETSAAMTRRAMGAVGWRASAATEELCDTVSVMGSIPSSRAQILVSPCILSR